MSSRAVRKAMKRLEEQKQLELEPTKDDQVETDEDDDDDTVGTPVNPFAMVSYH